MGLLGSSQSEQVEHKLFCLGLRGGLGEKESTSILRQGTTGKRRAPPGPGPRSGRRAQLGNSTSPGPRSAQVAEDSMDVFFPKVSFNILKAINTQLDSTEYTIEAGQIFDELNHMST